MTSPRIFASTERLAGIRCRLAEHDWYARAFANLRGPADALLRHGIEIPREKGFVFHDTCPRDDATLVRDPFNSVDHRCPTCGTNYTAEPYRRAWITYYHSYVSQRAVELGIIYQVTGEAAYAQGVRHILREYGQHYAEYPLQDCVLGPTRLFQSTYMESLWLASLAGAADLVRDAIPATEWKQLRDQLFLPATAVIMDFDEGRNNRQVMNNAAIGLVGVLLEDQRLFDHAVHGPHGWRYHLEHSVLPDGAWYEGNNYHFATLAAMINLAEAAAGMGVDLYRADVGGRRLQQMFDAPLLDLQPDLTFPARKDSRFASTMGQRWYAGMYELGYRRYGDPRYGGLLREIYENPPAAGSLSNAAGLIDVRPSARAHREALDWRGFLNAVPDLGSVAAAVPTVSVNLTGTGEGVLRQDEGRTYASIDYGHYGGGHGHPDRLQLNFFARGRRWLCDWGTGSYLPDHLRWYRSSVGHNTVVVDGASHQPVDGYSRRFGATAGAALISAAVDDVYPGVSFGRTAILLAPDLLLDLFTVESDREQQLDWVLHSYGDLTVEGVPSVPAPIEGREYEWLRDVRRTPALPGWRARFRNDGDALAVHMLGADTSTTVFTARAYGPPDEIPDLFPVLIARRHAARTTYAVLLEHRDREKPAVHSFSRTAEGYDVALVDGTRVVCRYDSSAAVLRYRTDGSLAEVIGFGETEVPGAFRTDFPQDSLAVQFDGDIARVSAADRFGRVQVLHPDVRQVSVNGAAPVRGREVRQGPRAWIDLPAQRLPIGVATQLELTIVNYRPDRLSGDLGLEWPAGWAFPDAPTRIEVQPWSSTTLRLTVIAGDRPGTLTVGLFGETLALAPVAPIECDAWRPNLAGPLVRVRLRSNSRDPLTATVSVDGCTRRVEVVGTRIVELPVSWRDDPLEVRVRCGDFQVRQVITRPIAFLGGEYLLDRADQIRRSERHWRGPSDLSARFRVELVNRSLRLVVAVTDDRLVSSGSVEAPYDYDGVQIYFDTRPDRERSNAGLDGIVGLLLIPAAPDGLGGRVFRIGASGVTDAPEGVRLASRLRADGYDLDVVVPLTLLRCDPQAGDKIGFDLIVNDNDGTFRRSLQLVWSGADGTRTFLQGARHAPQRYGALVFG